MYNTLSSAPGDNSRPVEDPVIENWSFEQLRSRAGRLDGADLIRLVLREAFRSKIALVSSFGTESAVLLALAAEIDPSVPVLFLETAKHFPETIEYRDELVRHLGLTDVRDIRPDPVGLQAEDPEGRLSQRDPNACCALRKVAPLREALAPFDAWISGRKRFQGGREGLPTVETVDGRIKINPLAGWSYSRIQAEFDGRGLPRHPLEAFGYLSVGCAPCTTPTPMGAETRAGRWAGLDKTECGIHYSI
jgi:phosphoadenosine phosphosulfate reductase